MEKKSVKQIGSNPDEIAKKKPRLICNLPVPVISTKVGNLHVCGQGDMGQLGLGEDEMERKRPTLNASVKDVVDISAGGMHSLCLTKDGYVFSFGCNDEGALGRETTEDGSEFIPNRVNLPSKCTKIAAGDSHSAFLLDDGRVFACGSFRNSHGNMGLTLEGNKRLPIEVLPGVKSCDIASGADHLIILTCTGKIFTIGSAEQGQLGRVALRSALGESRRGKSDLLTPGLVPVHRGKLSQRIWATNYCSFAEEFNTSKIYAFGLNNYNQLGIKQMKEVIVRPTETDIKNIEIIAGGQHHTLILTKDKKCYAIGKKDYGRLGLGEIKEDVNQFEEINILSSKIPEFISCGDAQSFAITSEGMLFAWGMGSNFQLGTGSENDELEPVHITSKSIQNKQILKVSSGGQHTLLLVEKEETDKTVLNNGQISPKNAEENLIQKSNKDKVNPLKENIPNVSKKKMEENLKENNGNLDDNKAVPKGGVAVKQGRKRKNN